MSKVLFRRSRVETSSQFFKVGKLSHKNTSKDLKNKYKIPYVYPLRIVAISTFQLFTDTPIYLKLPPNDDGCLPRV